MELVAKKSYTVLETSFKERLHLFLEILVLFSCSKPSFSHEEMEKKQY
jgi:hypothetical protein